MRQTKQRTAIADLLRANADFQTAQAIHESLRATGNSIGLATVYRNLQGMTESGEIDSIRTPDGEQAYRMCSPHHHHHLVCTKCGKTIELAATVIETWLADVVAKTGFAHVDHDIELRGLCNTCA